MTKMEYVEYLMSKYEGYKERAQQYEFVKLFYTDMIIKPYYNDLKKNYVEEHADIFIKHMSELLRTMGIDILSIEVTENNA